jgi:hypothetical protein
MAALNNPITIFNSSKLGYTVKTNPFNANTNVKQHFVVVHNCFAAERCKHWIPPTLNYIGCGINAIKFMGQIDETNASLGIQQAVSSNIGTPFQHMITWFNRKINSTKNMFINEQAFDITTKVNLQGFYNLIIDVLLNNSCILVKYNRSDSRPSTVTPGHYVLLTKENDKLYTYEPLTSTSEKCDKRELKNNNVSDNFFKVMNNQYYITASVMVVNIDINYGINYMGGNYKGGNNIIHFKNNINMNDMINDLVKNYKCKIPNKNGGNKSSNAPKNITIKKKTKGRPKKKTKGRPKKKTKSRLKKKTKSRLK